MPMFSAITGNAPRTDPGLQPQVAQLDMADGDPVLGSCMFTDFDRAVSATELPLAVWKPDGEIRLVNAALAELVGKPVDGLVGQSVTIFAEIFSPSLDIQTTLAYLGSGAVESVRSDRLMKLPGRPPVKPWVLSRMIDVEESRIGITVFLPVAFLDRPGRDPAGLWRELSDVAVGIADDDWTVIQISVDIRGILGVPPADVVGTSLRDWMHPQDQSLSGGLPGVQSRVRVRDDAGNWVTASLLWLAQPGHTKRRLFTLVPVPAPLRPATGHRVAELELRLRRIGAEVQAAGVLDGLGSLPALEQHPGIAELSTRQWDIVTRLVRGENARTIAAELYLSPSTVRNHLSAIYRKFGIHSQVELIRMLA